MLLNPLMQTNPEWCMHWPFLQPVQLADISDEQPSVSIPSRTQMGGIVWLLCPSWIRVPLYPPGIYWVLCCLTAPSRTHESCPMDIPLGICLAQSSCLEGTYKYMQEEDFWSLLYPCGQSGPSEISSSSQFKLTSPRCGSRLPQNKPDWNLLFLVYSRTLFQSYFVPLASLESARLLWASNNTAINRFLSK